jgi:hypothetical protein
MCDSVVFSHLVALREELALVNLGGPQASP